MPVHRERNKTLTELTPETREAIEAGHLAHLVTLNPDGSPQLTVVWVGLEGDEIVAAHLAEHKKVKNIRRDSRVVLSVETGGFDDRGFANYLVVYGSARVTEGGAVGLMKRLWPKYIGEGVPFPAMENPPAGLITRISIDRVAGVGPWAQS